MSLTLRKFDKRLAAERYLGWTIECQSFERPVCTEFYSRSACFGRFLANKPVVGGSLFLIQPFWISNDEMKGLKTPLAKENAIDYMLKMGRRAIKYSIRKHRNGLITIPVTSDVPVLTGDRWAEQRFIV